MQLKPKQYAPKTGLVQLFKKAILFRCLGVNNIFFIISRLSLLVFIVFRINPEFKVK